MHVYCVPRGVKRKNVVKEALNDVCRLVIRITMEIWNKIYTLDVTKFQFNILFVDIINVQVFVKKQSFS